MAAEPNFKLPPLNDGDSWGPDPAYARLPLDSIPFAPYSKADRLGRIADWNEPEGRGQQDRGTGPTGPTAGRPRGQQRGRDGQQVYGSGSTSTFAYFHQEDETSFSLVDNKTGGPRRAGAPGFGGRGRGQGGRGLSSQGSRGGQRGGRGGFQPRNQFNRGNRRGWRDWDKVHSCSNLESIELMCLSECSEA
jgi:translation initiation factor 3 subunit D